MEIRCVGTHFRGAGAVALLKSLKPGTILSLVPEPSNTSDPCAIKVVVQTSSYDEPFHLGYVPSQTAALFSSLGRIPSEVKLIRTTPDPSGRTTHGVMEVDDEWFD